MGELPPSPPSTAVSTPWGDTTLVRGGGCEGRGGGEELPLSPPSTAVSTPWGDTTLVRGGGCEGRGGGGGAASVTALNGCLYAVGGYDSGEGVEGVEGRGEGGRVWGSCLCHRPQRLPLRRGGIRLVRG